MNIRKIIASLTLGLLVSLSASSAKETRFYVYNAANGLADNSAQTLTCTKTGRLVITTMGQINFFDGQHFTYIDPSSENIFPLEDYFGNYHLYFDRYHHLWLKNRHSVTCVDLTTESFVNSVENVFKELGVTEKVTDIFCDQRNEVWLLTAKGLYSTEMHRFYKVRERLNLQDVEVYEDRYLMLFYGNGLLEVLDLKSGGKLREVMPFDEKKQVIYSGTSVVYADGKTIYQIRNGQQHGILMSLDVDNWQFKSILEVPYSLNNITKKDSLCYIPSAYGYWTFDQEKDKLEHTEYLQLASGGKLLTDINAIAFDKQGGMWAGTELRGLLYARPMASPFHVYTWEEHRATELAAMMDRKLTIRTVYRDKPVNCVFRDSRGWDWVGTSTGLQLYKDKNRNLPEVITRRDGLLNNVIHTIIEDDDHHIWVGTSYGLSCLVINDKGIRYLNNYNSWDGIPTESFVNGRAIRLPDGSIAMQMLDHVLEFNPLKMITLDKKGNFSILPKLIRIMVNGNVIKTGQEVDGEVILPKAVSRTPVINLNYNQNSVSLTFSALNYFRPQQTYYKVRVNGLDDTWRILTQANSGGLVDRQGQLHLPLVSLKPGSYRIEVQTSMVPDEWNTVPYEWVVNIHEPWWRTTGVMVIYGLLISLLVIINLYLYIRNSRMRAVRKSEEQSVIKRIKNLVERCNNRSGEKLEPIPDEINGYISDPQNELTSEFMDMMIKIMPVVQSNKPTDLTMQMLSSAAGMDISKFYGLVMTNIYKSPRPLARRVMLKHAAELLEKTDKNMGEIAYECGFISANFMIASFFRHKKMTPESYRRYYGMNKGEDSQTSDQ